jgi:signal transduction histidine kinase
VRVTESLLVTLAVGYAGTLEPEQAELLGRARRRLASLHALIDDLLDLAAGKAAMVVPQQVVVDVGAIAAEVVERFQAVAAGKGLALELRSAPGPLDVFADPADLERIIGNLVANAVQYTPRGSVSVSVAVEQDHVRVSVQDTGIGIEREALPNVFREFYRAPNAKTLAETGTGLGLAIVKLLADRLGGRVTVVSRVGEGSTFSFEMARAESA